MILRIKIIWAIMIALSSFIFYSCANQISIQSATTQKPIAIQSIAAIAYTPQSTLDILQELKIQYQNIQIPFEICIVEEGSSEGNCRFSTDFHPSHTLELLTTQEAKQKRIYNAQLKSIQAKSKQWSSIIDVFSASSFSFPSAEIADSIFNQIKTKGFLK